LPLSGIQQKTIRSGLRMFIQARKKRLGGFARLIPIIFGKLQSEIARSSSTAVGFVLREANTFRQGVPLQTDFRNLQRNGIPQKMANSSHRMSCPEVQNECGGAAKPIRHTNGKLLSP
jgi:hypothetical protein